MRNIINNCQQVGDSIYTSPQDGTATYASAITLTMAGMAFVPVASQFLLVEQYTAGGAVIRYPAASYQMLYTAPTLTVMGANFLTTDLAIRVYWAGPSRAYNQASDYYRFGEVDPLDQHSELVNLVDGTNLASAEYPSANGLDMLGRNYFSINGTMIEATAGKNIAVKVWGSNDEEPVGASKIWNQLYGRRVDIGGVEVNVIVCPTTTVTFAWEFFSRFRYIKVATTVDDAVDNTIALKMHLTAL